MANTAFKNPVAIWPLGKITVTSHGTPVDLTTNVGAQIQSATNFLGSKRIRQIVFFPDPANTGSIFITKKGHPYTDTNCVCAIIFKPAWSQQVSLPDGALVEGALFSPDDFSVDADADSQSVYAVGIYG